MYLTLIGKLLNLFLPRNLRCDDLSKLLQPGLKGRLADLTGIKWYDAVEMVIDDEEDQTGFEEMSDEFHETAEYTHIPMVH